MVVTIGVTKGGVDEPSEGVGVDSASAWLPIETLDSKEAADWGIEKPCFRHVDAGSEGHQGVSGLDATGIGGVFFCAELDEPVFEAFAGLEDIRRHFAGRGIICDEGFGSGSAGRAARSA